MARKATGQMLKRKRGHAHAGDGSHDLGRHKDGAGPVGLRLGDDALLVRDAIPTVQVGDVV